MRKDLSNRRNRRLEEAIRADAVSEPDTHQSPNIYLEGLCSSGASNHAAASVSCASIRDALRPLVSGNSSLEAR